MAKVKIQGNASGTGVLTVTAPNTSTDRTITLPDSTGTILDENSSLPAGNLTGNLPAIDGSALTGIDLTSIRNDIATLALHSAIADNKAAYNLPNSFIDQFEDDTGIETETDGDRINEHWCTVSVDSQTFVTGSGTWSPPSGLATAEILIVGGGASGGRSPNIPSGGGGGGGIAYIASYTFTATDLSSGIAYAIGDGGVGVGTGTYDAVYGQNEGVGNNGADTTFALSGGTITGKGGGTSGGYDAVSYRPARSGGSGGGGSHGGSTSNPGASSSQGTFSGWTTYGNAGGNGVEGSGGGGGGGGAGTAGQDGVGSQGGNGGDGQLFSNFTSYGDSGYFGGGGGGANGTGGAGGSGGGGAGTAGGNANGVSGEDGTDGTGGGGGATSVAGYNSFNEKGGDGGNGFIGINYEIISASGTLISTAQTASAAQTKVSGVILYKNNTGTATLGTDLKIYFTCNGGTNWTESTPVASGTFSSGILMAKCPEVTCTSGTDIRYKAVWANQEALKTTQLHGIGMNY